MHPFVTSGETYTNTMMLDIYYGLVERHEIKSDYTDANTFGNDFTGTYQAFTGISSAVSILTNGIYIVTNSLDTPIYESVTLTNDACFIPFVHEGYTNLPHVMRSHVVAMDDIDTLPYIQFWESDGEGLFEQYLNDAIADTNSTTDNFPYIANPGVILTYTNAGYVTNRTYDALGTVDGSYWTYTRQPPTTQNWNLAEGYVITSNTTGFRANTPLDYNHFGDEVPTLVYTAGGTNAYQSATWLIEGTVFDQLDSATQRTTTPDNQPTHATNETIVMAATNLVNLTYVWHNITNMSTTSTLTNTGDTWSVVYTNKVALYGSSDWVLDATDINERLSVVDGMRWTGNDEDLVGVANKGWIGQSTTSWAEAKSLAEGGTISGPWIVGSDSVACQFTLGWKFNGAGPGLFVWQAQAFTALSTLKVSPDVFKGTNMFSADIYTKCTVGHPTAQGTSTNWSYVLNTYDHDWMDSTNQYYAKKEAALTLGTVSNIFMGLPKYGAIYLGSTNFPDWCAEPGVGAPSAEGYTIWNLSSANAPASVPHVLKFDGPDGFQYIRD